MRIIEIAPLENGAHRNQQSASIVPVPIGWARIPDTMTVPDTFPFVNIEVEGDTVTSMTAGVVPEPEPVPDEPHVPTNEELAAENKKLASQLQAAIESNSMLEDCLAEMAEVVYA